MMYDRHERVLKPIDKPNHISLLAPTRNRPDFIDVALQSVEDTVSDFDNIDVWIYVDHDDKKTIEYIDSLPDSRFSFKIHWQTGPCVLPMGQMVNYLRKVCSTNPGIFLLFGDDCIFKTKNWDDIIREEFAKYPDGIVAGYIPDPVVKRSDMLMFAAFTAKWTNITGKIYTNYFPFWADDTWLDQVTQLVQRRIRFEDIYIEHSEKGKGKTKRMKNMPFWNKYLHCLIDERFEEAQMLLKAIHGQDTEQYFNSLEHAKTLVNKFIERGNKNTIEILEGLERKHSSYPQEPGFHLMLVYLALESQAVSDLFGKVDLFMQSGDYIKALYMLNIIKHADQKYIQVDHLRSICFQKLGTDAHSVEVSKAEQCMNPGFKTIQKNAVVSGFDQSGKRVSQQSDFEKAKNLFNHAIGLLNNGNVVDSLRNLKEVMKLCPIFPNLYFALASVYAHAGDLLEAKKACKKEITLNPQNKMAMQFYQKINQAIEQSRRTAELISARERDL